MSSCPSMRTIPPSGSARSEYSVSPMPLRASSASDISTAALPCAAMVRGSVEPATQPMPFRYPSTTGPMPTAKLSHRIPAHRAARKCPSSCTAISRPNPSSMRMTFQPFDRTSMGCREA